MDKKIKEPQKIEIKPYSSIWHMQTKIYSIDNIKLIVPIVPWNILYFVIGVFIATFFHWVIPMGIHPILRIGILPMAFVYLVTKVKLDGKKPHKFFYSLFKFWVQPKKYEYFRPLESSKLKGFNEKVYLRRER